MQQKHVIHTVSLERTDRYRSQIFIVKVFVFGANGPLLIWMSAFRGFSVTCVSLLNCQTERSSALWSHLRTGGDDSGVSSASQEEKATGKKQVARQQQRFPVCECNSHFTVWHFEMKDPRLKCSLYWVCRLHEWRIFTHTIPLQIFPALSQKFRRMIMKRLESDHVTMKSYSCAWARTRALKMSCCGLQMPEAKALLPAWLNYEAFSAGASPETRQAIFGVFQQDSAV